MVPGSPPLSPHCQVTIIRLSVIKSLIINLRRSHGDSAGERPWRDHPCGGATRPGSYLAADGSAGSSVPLWLGLQWPLAGILPPPGGLVECGPRPVHYCPAEPLPVSASAQNNVAFVKRINFCQCFTYIGPSVHRGHPLFRFYHGFFTYTIYILLAT